MLQDSSVWSKSHALDATHCGLALCLPHSHSVTLPAVDTERELYSLKIPLKSKLKELVEGWMMQKQ